MHNINMTNIKRKIIYIIIPIVIGAIIGLITKNHIYYIKASIAPPDIVFPIVWTILYGILGYTFFELNENYNDKIILRIFLMQLLINYLWPILFFKLGLLYLSFLWIILLDLVVLVMILKLYKISVKLFYINVPYFIWLLFATILNYMTYIIN